MHLTPMEILDAGDAGEVFTRHDKSGEPFTVRAYRASDRDGLQEFYDRFEPPRVAQGLPPKGRDRVARWLDTILASGVHLVAIRGDSLIGHALVVPLEKLGMAEYAVFLDHSQRGKGVGTELNRLAIDFARRAGFRHLWLSVEPHNRAAIRSYEKVGFRFRPGTIFSPETEMTLELEG